MFSAIVRHNVIRRFVKNVSKKPPPQYTQRKTQVSDLITQMMANNKTIETTTDWSAIRDKMLTINNHITQTNVDLLTMNHCLKINDYWLGKSYLEFLQKNGYNTNLATIGKFLRLFYYSNLNSDVSESEEDSIIAM